jgi:hypothetical protein
MNCEPVDLLAAALEHARAGRPVFPIHHILPDGTCSCSPGRECRNDSPGKHPRIRNWQRLATTEESQVRKWWATWPESNIGVPTGKASGLLVVDIDPRHGGNESRARLVEEHGELPETREVETGGGGRHLLYAFPDDPEAPRALRNRSPLRDYAGIDIRAEGGLVVAPPSGHRSGRRYAYRNGSDHPVAPAPPWLLDLIRGQSERGQPAEPRSAPTGGTPYGRKALVRGVARVRSSPNGMRNTTLNAVAFSLGRLAAGGELEVEVVREDLEAAGVATGLGADAVRRTVESGLTAGLAKPRRAPARKRAASPVALREAAGLPEIRITPDLPAMVDEAQAALLADGGSGLYERAGLLVRIRPHVPRPGQPEVKEAIRYPEGLPRILTADFDWLIERLAAAAYWLRFSAKTEDWIPALPDRQAVKSLLARGAWPFPLLEGVAEHPFLRPDGTLVQQAGHDAETGVLYLPTRTFPPVPDRPSAVEVTRAVDALRAPVAEFSFVDDSDRAAALALTLSLVARAAVPGPVPLFGITARSPGEGKSLLAVVLALSSGERRPSTMAWPTDWSDQRKLLLSICLEGLPVVLLDNIEGQLGSPLLSQILTSMEFSDRVLGVNRTASAPHRTVWIGTGNNLSYRGDTYRRAVPIHLDGGCEKPEERAFHIRNLHQYVLERQPELCSAALTILRAYHLAGRPAHGGARIGSFEAWDDLVRGAVCWAIQADPAGGRERVRQEADRDLETMRDLFSVWHEANPDEPWLTLKDIVERAAAEDSLRQLLTAVAAKKDGEPDVPAIGNRFRAWEGRIAGGLRLEKNPKKTNRGAQWRIHAMGGRE